MEPAAATRTEVTVKLSLTPEEEQMLLAEPRKRSRTWQAIFTPLSKRT